MIVPSFLRPTRKKIIIFSILLTILILGLIIFARPREAQQQFVIVRKQDIKSIVSSSGILTGRGIVDLRFKTGGKLAFTNINVGDEVFAGQVIAGIDAPDLGITLQQARNTLRDTQATTDKVLNDIHLFQYGNGGFANVGTANETMTQRQLRTSAEVARDNAVDNIKAAQIAFQDTIITTPINGLVTQAVSIPGVIVSAVDTIAQVVDHSEIIFETDVDESDIANISVGQRVEITLDAYPSRIFRGVVDVIEPQIKITTSGATVVTVKIKTDAAVTFINGLSGQASIITAEKSKVLTIPQEALREDNTVVIIKDNKLIEQKVAPGIMSDIDVEIKSGLEENDKVLLNPPAPGTKLN